MIVKWLRLETLCGIGMPCAPLYVPYVPAAPPRATGILLGSGEESRRVRLFCLSWFERPLRCAVELFVCKRMQGRVRESFGTECLVAMVTREKGRKGLVPRLFTGHDSGSDQEAFTISRAGSGRIGQLKKVSRVGSDRCR